MVTGDEFDSHSGEEKKKKKETTINKYTGGAEMPWQGVTASHMPIWAAAECEARAARSGLKEASP